MSIGHDVERRGGSEGAAPREERSEQRESSGAGLRGLSYADGVRALAPVQADTGGMPDEGVHAAAARGVSGGGGALPHAERIQASFGRHDVSGVQAHVGGAAADATDAIGASAYATGNHVAFGGAPDLHTAAHEAAHVVQQRAGVSLYGGVGKAGDAYERHADAVADRVVAGQSAEPLLDQMAGGGASTSATDRGPVQMYSQVPVGKQKAGRWQAGVDLRVSDDGRMAVADGTHQMWATTDIIAHGDGVLLNNGSPYSLTAGANVLEGPPPGVKKGIAQRLHEVVPMNYDNGTTGDTMKTIEACSSHGQHMMGAGLNKGAHNMATGMAVVTRNALGGEDERRYDKRGSAGGGRTDMNLVGDIRAEVTGTSRDTAEDAFGSMSKRDKNREAQELGINQYAEPEAGEGLAVYAAVDKLKKGSFPMHFAGVIAKSGGDYVTLENYAKAADRKVGDTAFASADWYFKMFGPANKKQSFFDELAKEGDYGGEKGTMVLRHRKVDGYDEPEVVQEGRRVYDKCLRFAQTASGHTYPTFIAAWLPFRKALTTARNELTAAWTAQRAPAAEILDELDHLTTTLKATAACTQLMADAAPVPEVAPVVVDPVAVGGEDASVDD